MTDMIPAMASHLFYSIIQNNPDLPWNYYHGVSENPNLTIDFIQDNIDKDWKWSEISCHHFTKN